MFNCGLSGRCNVARKLGVAQPWLGTPCHACTETQQPDLTSVSTNRPLLPLQRGAERYQRAAITAMRAIFQVCA